MLSLEAEIYILIANAFPDHRVRWQGMYAEDSDILERWYEFFKTKKEC